MPYSIHHTTRDVLPGDTYDNFKKHDPLFHGYDYMHERVDCRHPHPWIYFENSKAASYSFFHNKQKNFPMATDYMDTSGWARPKRGHYQTVLGFAEMQGPYYQWVNKKLDPKTPYLVMSMGPDYSPKLNFKFVECGLLGWPGNPQLKP